MSSYLSFYVVPKRKSEAEPKDYRIVVSYSRSCEIYQRFSEEMFIAYAGNEDKYTTLDLDSVTRVIKSFNDDIKKAQNRLTEYEKYASTNPDYISEIIDMKEYIEELQYWRDKTSFIQDMVEELSYNYESGIEEICCNVD